eukprot:TRINITY_DN11746_c0_g1_i4.p3 TRINITY_DN11746_c0_g1~~TRINITY_DN11746_c0_g1_i4.p3  ORF type:complete len:126 (+),score=18.45 TRINITY_DN11746_c0_g1_i4:1005-1382(+)
MQVPLQHNRPAPHICMSRPHAPPRAPTHSLLLPNHILPFIPHIIPLLLLIPNPILYPTPPPHHALHFPRTLSLIPHLLRIPHPTLLRRILLCPPIPLTLRPGSFSHILHPNFRHNMRNKIWCDRY